MQIIIVGEEREKIVDGLKDIIEIKAIEDCTIIEVDDNLVDNLNSDNHEFVALLCKLKKDFKISYLNNKPLNNL